MQTLEVDELIIGAGLTGLMYGNVAVAPDYRVALAESHFKPGGYATNFRRLKNRVAFDCSQHKITGVGPNGNLRNALVRAGLWDKLRFEYFNELATVLHRGKAYHFPATGPEIEAFLLREFPHEAAGIRHFHLDINTHGRQNYMFARMMLGEYALDKELLPESRALSKLTTKEYFRQRFRDDALIEILSSLAIYLGAIAHEANAFYFLHYLYAAFETRPAYVRGTSQSLSDTLAREFARRGGQLTVRNPVLGIETHEGRIVAVTTQKCRFLTTKVTATCAPAVVMSLLPAPQAAEYASFQHKLSQLEEGWGHISLYLVTDRPPAELGLTEAEYLLVHDAGDDLPASEWHTDARYEKLTLSATNYHQLDPQSGMVVQLTILDHDGRWFCLTKAEYKAEKERVQNLLLERAYRYFPALRGHITYVEASTPRTNFRYTNSPKGSAFGYKVLPRDNMRFLSRPPVDGLRFVGGWGTGPGYETGLCLGFTHAFLERQRRTAPVPV
ncbi:phytoene desaturase family protein [Hymenobacter rubripertinctus]|uniref:NAD(P)/FAD-dependent oxidoreductase n=1 Tax=Hymenobacter rubripertinctus TaxID=2029981 RepID=A0A418QWL9_9BACT|nr:FAD-dependent oxidoreductase [Hymenobacter rubripertinctus]RIY09568.1 NAD(P)/FAD-dependent oxidoreductase [Hymenobacter rubripertinctus]